MDDKLLIERIADGEKAAIQSLFARHHTRLYRSIARQVGNPSMAEEITNEVFLEVWKNAARYEGRSSVSTWIMAIAHNKAVSAMRKRQEVLIDDDEISLVGDTADNPEVVAQKSNKADAIRAAIEKLSPDHKKIIDLSYYHEMSIREVAEVLDIPENTVKTRMFHARKNLANLLEKAGVDRGWP